MKIGFKHSIIPAIAMMVIAGSPASAQLLGGGGGGGLTGGLGGTIGQTTGSITGMGTGSVSGEKSVDTRAGRVRGSGQAKGNANGSTTGTTDVLGTPMMGAASGAADGSANGGADASLVGTDFVRATAADGVTRTSGVVDTARGTSGAALGQARTAGANAVGSASGATSAMGSLAGNGSAFAQGSLGQLAASGSAAANGVGMFAIEPGMPIEDAKGRVIGYVQQIQQTKNGVVQAVTVEVGNRVATLPAANFSGSGDALVTGMSKGEIKSASKDQSPGEAAATPASSDTTPAAKSAPTGTGGGQERQADVKND